MGFVDKWPSRMRLWIHVPPNNEAQWCPPHQISLLLKVQWDQTPAINGLYDVPLNLPKNLFNTILHYFILCQKLGDNILLTFHYGKGQAQLYIDGLWLYDDRTHPSWQPPHSHIGVVITYMELHWSSFSKHQVPTELT